MVARSSRRIPDELMDRVNELAERSSSIEADRWSPTKTFTDTHDLRIGTHAVQLRHVGPGHTDNDVFVWLPELNVLHTGDLLFHKRHPFIDRAADATTTGWMTSLDAMIGLCDAETIVIPGHGELTDVEGLRGQKAYFERVREMVAGAIEKGASRGEVQRMAIDGTDGYQFEQLRANALGAIYEELSEGS